MYLYLYIKQIFTHKKKTEEGTEEGAPSSSSQFPRKVKIAAMSTFDLS